MEQRLSETTRAPNLLDCKLLHYCKYNLKSVCINITNTYEITYLQKVKYVGTSFSLSAKAATLGPNFLTP